MDIHDHNNIWITKYLTLQQHTQCMRHPHILRDISKSHYKSMLYDVNNVILIPIKSMSNHKHKDNIYLLNVNQCQLYKKEVSFSHYTFSLFGQTMLIMIHHRFKSSLCIFSEDSDLKTMIPLITPQVDIEKRIKQSEIYKIFISKFDHVFVLFNEITNDHCFVFTPHTQIKPCSLNDSQIFLTGIRI